MIRLTPVFWALLDETLLHRVVGDRRVMADQLAYVAGLAESGRIRVHVMPRDRGAYPVIQSMLSLMWFEDQPPVAYSEGIQVAKIHDSPAVVERLQGAYYHALSDAMSLRETVALLKSTAKDYVTRCLNALFRMRPTLWAGASPPTAATRPEAAWRWWTVIPTGYPCGIRRTRLARRWSSRRPAGRRSSGPSRKPPSLRSVNTQPRTVLKSLI
ncbi:hypothetical protein GCM10010279_06110 [Streptomyces mutabilis]|nr:hypothetical protein GCM10010279_06110 [Streptomyces mutabilis]